MMNDIIEILGVDSVYVETFFPLLLIIAGVITSQLLSTLLGALLHFVGYDR